MVVIATVVVVAGIVAGCMCVVSWLYSCETVLAVSVVGS